MKHKGRVRRNKVIAVNITQALYNSIEQEAIEADENMSSMSAMILRLGLRMYQACDHIRADNSDEDTDQCITLSKL